MNSDIYHKTSMYAKKSTPKSHDSLYYVSYGCICGKGCGETCIFILYN